MPSSEHFQARLLQSIVAACVLSLVALSAAAEPKIVREGKGNRIVAATLEVETVDSVDYTESDPLPLPVAEEFSEALATDDMVNNLVHGVSQEPARYFQGAVGNGEKSPVFLGKPKRSSQTNEELGAAPEAHGTANRPFTTARADGATGTTTNIYPWRAAGRLFATIPTVGNGTCSASLIKRGLVVTAAHCVSKFGVGVGSNIRFVPGYRSGQAPFGTWQGAQVRILASYINGTDQCAAGGSGVVCRNDVAVLTLAPQAGKFPGTQTGWYGFGSGAAGFTNSGLTHITQLGYPSCLNNGELMQRNDAQGAITASFVNNTVIGSLMCGGSSGGPWLINFGHPSQLTGASTPAQSAANAVIGTTSWVSGGTGAIKQMGASPFTSQNIVALVNAACAATPAACN